MPFGTSIPAINLYDPVTTGPGASCLVFNAPEIVAMDITQEMIDEGVWVEMVMYKRRKEKVIGVDTGGGNIYGPMQSGYVIPSPWVGGVNTLRVDIGQPILTRGGDSIILADRPNHYKLTSVNEAVPVWQYLTNRFTTSQVQYRSSTNAWETAPVTVPATGRGAYGLKPGARYSYGPVYTPMYVAFRYIMWKQSANNGLGQFVAGPLSQRVKIANNYHPFIQEPYATAIHGKACCELNPKFYNISATAYLTAIPGNLTTNLKTDGYANGRPRFVAGLFGMEIKWNYNLNRWEAFNIGNPTVLSYIENPNRPVTEGIYSWIDVGSTNDTNEMISTSITGYSTAIRCWIETKLP